VSIDNVIYSLHYTGIDTPETAYSTDPFGPEVSRKNAELVGDKTLTLVKDVSEVDKYNRLLRFVFVGELFGNYELIRQGFATALTYPPDIVCAGNFNQLERDILALKIWKARI